MHPKFMSDTDTDGVPKMYYDTWYFFIVSSDFCLVW